MQGQQPFLSKYFQHCEPVSLSYSRKTDMDECAGLELTSGLRLALLVKQGLQNRL